jgi:hypothetical protein
VPATLVSAGVVGGTLVELIPCSSCRCCKCDSSCSPKLCHQVHASWG